MLALLSKPSCHPLPLLRRRANDSSAHERAQVLHQDAAVDLGYQQLVRSSVHPLIPLKVVFDQFHDLIQWFWVTQPLSLYQAVKQGLGGGSRERENRSCDLDETHP